MKNKKRKEALTAYLMLIPDFFGIGLFVFIPMIAAVFISFNRWNGITEMEFIGLDNYRKLLQDSEFKNSLIVTFKYAIMYIPSVYFVSLGLALFINSLKGRLESIARMSFFVPYSISTVVAALIWTFMYDPKKGYINKFLNLLGIKSQEFLGSGNQALYSVLLVSLWLVVGYNMMIFLSALKEVPKSIYEAAEMDGANFLQRFLFITMPQIKNTSIFILIVTSIGSFQVFDTIQIMTSGGPARTTEVAAYQIYYQAFTMYDFGYASAMSVVLFMIILVFSLLQFKTMGMKGTD